MAPIGEADEVFFNRPGVVIVKWDSTIQAVSTEWQDWADRPDFINALEASLGARLESSSGHDA